MASIPPAVPRLNPNSPTKYSTDLYRSLENSPPPRSRRSSRGLATSMRSTAAVSPRTPRNKRSVAFDLEDGGESASAPSAGRRSGLGGGPSFPSADFDLAGVLGVSRVPSASKPRKASSRNLIGRAAIAQNVFDTSLRYFVGTWRRQPYEFFSEPSCLNGRDHVHLDTYEATKGTLWRFVPSEIEASGFYLECADGVGDDEPRFVACGGTGDAPILVETEDDAAMLRFEFTAPFRDGPGDVAIKIFNERGQILASDETNNSVMWLTEAEADRREHDGTWMFNNAWEVTPDVDDLEMDAWLKQYMNDDNPAFGDAVLL